MNTPDLPEKIYFKNLNAIRFFAAFVVICHHIEQNKSNFQIPNYWGNDVVIMVGRLGVILFFVISGFLISFLLFKEKEKTQTINIKHFYLRRIFRIWPLYFLIVFLAFFVLCNVSIMNFGHFGKAEIWHNIKVNLPLFLLLLPNLARVKFSSLHFASHLWSIGAEEQFYLVWPVINKKIKNKWLVMFGVIVFYLIVKYIFWFLPDSYLVSSFNGFWYSTPIDCMAIGGIFSLIILEKNSLVVKIKAFIFTKIVQSAVLILTIYLVLTNFHRQYFHEEIYSILFGILILNFSANPNRIFSLDYPILNYLGKISYGLYMYHIIIIVFSIKLLNHFHAFRSIILYPMVFIFTIILAGFSYEYFELRFIKKKNKYTKIISGPSA